MYYYVSYVESYATYVTHATQRLTQSTQRNALAHSLATVAAFSAPAPAGEGQGNLAPTRKIGP